MDIATCVSLVSLLVAVFALFYAEHSHRKAKKSWEALMYNAKALESARILHKATHVTLKVSEKCDTTADEDTKIFTPLYLNITRGRQRCK